MANKTIKLNLNKNNTYKIFLDYCVYKYTVSSEILTIIEDICQIFAFILRPMQTYKGVSYLVRFYMISPQFHFFFCNTIEYISCLLRITYGQCLPAICL